MQLSKTAQEIKNRYNAKFEEEANYKPSFYNAFQFPKTPIITNKNRDSIELYNWGLIPKWAKDISIREYTLNARIETINQKPAFKSSINNRCLIITDGFFEWQWLDEKGKSKQKYKIQFPDKSIFSIAGLWSEWYDEKNNTLYKTYTLLTTEANELMSVIHNSKKRMPVILLPNFEDDWLDGAMPNNNELELVAERF